MRTRIKLSILERKEYQFRHELREANQKPFQVEYIIRRYENWTRRYHSDHAARSYDSHAAREGHNPTFSCPYNHNQKGGAKSK